MNTLHTTQNEAPAQRIAAFYTSVKKLGHWTDSRAFEVRARRGYAVLDLRSPRIPEGDIEIEVDLERSALKLLVPEDAVIDQWDLRMVGRGKVKDAQGAGQNRDRGHTDAAGGRRIRLVGQVARGEVRIARGGVAVLTAMLSRQFVEDCRRANREGGMPTVHDPAQSA